MGRPRLSQVLSTRSSRPATASGTSGCAALASAGSSARAVNAAAGPGDPAATGLQLVTARVLGAGPGSCRHSTGQGVAMNPERPRAVREVSECHSRAPQPSPRVVHAVQRVDVKLFTLQGKQELGDSVHGACHAGLPQFHLGISPTPRSAHSPAAQSTQQCPLHHCCPPGPPAARCGEEWKVRGCPPLQHPHPPNSAMS